MNNKEAVEAFLKGKTLKLKDVKTHTYKFDTNRLLILRSDNETYTMDDFLECSEWEEVKDFYKKQVIVIFDRFGYAKECGIEYPPISERINKKYIVTIEEISDEQ